MKVVILEDEIHASEYLAAALKDLRSDIEIVAVIDSIADGIEYFSNNAEPDLIFSDIRLVDGLSFDIFKNTNVKSKIIFVTAYDEYLLDSFKFNNLYYILKPVKKADLADALSKYDSLEKGNVKSVVASIDTTLRRKTRLIVETSDSYIPINISDISLVESDFKTCIIHLENGLKYPLNMSLKKMEETLPEESFIRVSRQWIVKASLIQSIEKSNIGKSRIVLRKGIEPESIEVSNDRVRSILALLS